MSLARTKENWLEIFATQTDGSPMAVANRVLGDVWGYDTITRPRNRYRDSDIETLATALEAYREFTI